jgi:hypothetical protein
MRGYTTQEPDLLETSSNKFGSHSPGKDYFGGLHSDEIYGILLENYRVYGTVVVLIRFLIRGYPLVGIRSRQAGVAEWYTRLSQKQILARD